MAQSYQYFIGISFPADFANELAVLQNQLYDPKTMLQPLMAHTTLLPPPALNKLEPYEFTRKTKKAIDDYLPVKLKLQEIHTFDRRVVYILVESDQFLELHKTAVSLLPKDAKEKIRSEFLPHLTIAQSKQFKKLSPGLMKQFYKEGKKLLPREYEINHLSLFLWQRPRDYKIIKF